MSENNIDRQELELSRELIRAMNKNLKLSYYKDVEGVKYNLISCQELFKIVKDVQCNHVEELKKKIERMEAFASRLDSFVAETEKQYNAVNSLWFQSRMEVAKMIKSWFGCEEK